MTAYILVFLAGIFAASIVGYFLHKLSLKNEAATLLERLNQRSIQQNLLQTELINLKSEKENLIVDAAKAKLLEEQCQAQSASLEKLREENKFVQNQFASIKEKLVAAEEKLSTQKEELGKIGEQFKFEFRSLAQNILEEKSEKFTQVNEEKMKAILDPLKSEIGIFKQKVEETYDKESKERFSLGKEIERLVGMTQQVSIDANNLTTALKGNNKMQGNWGEMILESLLENSGLTKGREYFIQQFIRDNSGNIIKDELGCGLQPDVTICYPDQRKIIVDSKVSLLAWDECIAQENKDDQLRCLQQHIKSIRLHIDGLSKKNYPKYALALDYVLLFIPIEPAFLEAVMIKESCW